MLQAKDGRKLVASQPFGICGLKGAPCPEGRNLNILPRSASGPCGKQDAGYEEGAGSPALALQDQSMLSLHQGGPETPE